MTKRFLMLAGLLLALLLPVSGAAEQASTADLVIAAQGFPYIGSLFDGDTVHGPLSGDHASVTLTLPEGFRYAYLIFDTEYGEFLVTDEETGQTLPAGQENFLHCLVDLKTLFGENPKTVTFQFENGPVPLLELTLFPDEPLPDWVQRWDPPVDNGADLVLFSTHADDEQLFFAGILPYYAGQRHYRVQVVYLTNHRNWAGDPNIRCHEALDGLWAVGVRHYPVFGSFADYYSRRKVDAETQFAQNGVSREELLGYVVEQIRRFRPLVAVGHDLNGEYGHGAHMLYAELLTQAAEAAADETCYVPSAARYGTWQIPKVYLHLYENNPIVMDWDKPLSHFGGLTAYQVTKQRGFAAHASQQWGFSWYMTGIDRAADIPEYSPCQYGLWSSIVGPDVEKNDFFECLIPYGRQEELARQAEIQARLDALALRERIDRMKRASVEKRLAALEKAPPIPAETAPQPYWIALFVPLLLVAGTVWLSLRKKP